MPVSEERSDRGKPEVSRGSAREFCLFGFVMVSYKAIILKFSLLDNKDPSGYKRIGVLHEAGVMEARRDKGTSDGSYEIIKIIWSWSGVRTGSQTLKE